MNTGKKLLSIINASGERFKKYGLMSFYPSDRVYGDLQFHAWINDDRYFPIQLEDGILTYAKEEEIPAIVPNERQFECPETGEILKYHEAFCIMDQEDYVINAAIEGYWREFMGIQENVKIYIKTKKGTFYSKRVFMSYFDAAGIGEILEGHKDNHTYRIIGIQYGRPIFADINDIPEMFPDEKKYINDYTNCVEKYHECFYLDDDNVYRNAADEGNWKEA